MTSKQLFISFLSLYCISPVPLCASKHKDTSIAGIGIPPATRLNGNNSTLDINDFLADLNNDTQDYGQQDNERTPDRRVSIPLTIPSDEPMEKDTEEIPNTIHELTPDIASDSEDTDGQVTILHPAIIGANFTGNSGHIGDQQLGGDIGTVPVAVQKIMPPVSPPPAPAAVLATDGAPMAAANAGDETGASHEHEHTHEEHREETHTTATSQMASFLDYQKAGEAAQWLLDTLRRHPRVVFISSSMGVATATLMIVRWRHNVHNQSMEACINRVLEVSGKKFSTLSPLQKLLLVAAYKHDFTAIQRCIEHDDIQKSLVGDDNAWVVDAIQQLVRAK